jgi:spore coat protein JC
MFIVRFIKLEYPVKIRQRNPKLAKIIIEQYGGPDGELGAALRYLSQRYSMVTPQAKATLNDIGTEEYEHSLLQRYLMQFYR